MNSTRQFLTLFRFQSTVNPFIWFMPLVFAVPLFIPLISGLVVKDFHSSLNLLLGNQNMFFVAIIGSMILAPGKFQYGSANLVTTSCGSEFMLTRAIDRPVLYRAKVALFYLLVLAMPLVGVIAALRHPDLVVREPAKAVQQACVSHVPGSALAATTWDRPGAWSLIAIPRGTILIAEWQLWAFAGAAIVLQLLMLILYPFKNGKIIFWILFLGFILVPLFDLTSMRSDLPTINDRLFFTFAAHQLGFWAITALVLLVTQLWCERRYAGLEQ